MAKKMTKFEKTASYFARHGARLERRKDSRGKIWYHLFATKRFGHIKPGDEMSSPAATLSPFEGMARRRFLG